MWKEEEGHGTRDTGHGKGNWKGETGKSALACDNMVDKFLPREDSETAPQDNTQYQNHTQALLCCPIEHVARTQTTDLERTGSQEAILLQHFDLVFFFVGELSDALACRCACPQSNWSQSLRQVQGIHKINSPKHQTADRFLHLFLI